MILVHAIEALFGSWLFLVYGALALTAWAAVARNDDVRPLAYVLLLAWAVSNAIAFSLPFEMRPALFPFIDLMVAAVAKQVWLRTGYKIAGVITFLSLVNCVVNVVYTWQALHTGEHHGLEYWHKLSTNLVFGAKCIMLGTWGASDALGWPNYLDLLRHGHWRHALSPVKKGAP